MNETTSFVLTNEQFNFIKDFKGLHRISHSLILRVMINYFLDKKDILKKLIDEEWKINEKK